MKAPHPENPGLRQRAEKKTRPQPLRGEASHGTALPSTLIHELEVHQIELKMQNDELLHTREQIEELAAHFIDLYDFAPVGFFSFDPSGRILWANLSASRLLGVERTRLAMRQFKSFVAEGERSIFNAFIQKVFGQPGKQTCQLTLQSSTPRPLCVRIEGVRSEDGKECRVAMLDIGEMIEATEKMRAAQAETQKLLELSERSRRVLLNVTEDAHMAAQALRESEERLRLALDAARMGTFEWDISHERITWSRLLEDLWGFKPGEFGGTYEAFAQRVHPNDISGINAEVTRCTTEHKPYAHEFRVVWPDGSTHWIAARGEFTFDENGQPSRMRGAVVEVTAHKQAEADIERLAYSDALTGLPNRTALRMHLEQSVQLAKNHARTMAILLLDLNNFREINDTLGHQNGDKVLVQLADRLRSALRPSDIVARLGGDEFAVLLSRLADKDHINLVIAKVLAAMRQPLMIADVPLDVQTAIGIALFPDHGQDADTLLQHADVALYAAKEKNLTHLLYSRESDDYNPQQLALMGELRLAIQREELTLHYQPVVDIKTGKTVGVEALVRWQHPSRGLIYPDTFIPAAEKTGLIASLTTWVLANALRQQHRWQRAGIDLNVSVNLSVRNLQQPDIVDEVRDMLLSSGVSPEKLTLEITETAIMVDPDRAKEVLTELHNFGIRFAIDDFGMGHSSLAYLKNLPVDKMKVDKSFVMDFKNPANAAIVRATIDLAHNLGLSVTAEGVEDESALNALGLLGCDHAQGYFLSRPQTVDKLSAWLSNSPWGLTKPPGMAKP